MKKTWIVAFLIGLMAASTTLAQEDKLLHVTVTSGSGRSVFLDQGRGAGIAVGMRVEFFPPGEGQVEGIVRAVSSNSSRVDLPPDIPLPPVGTRGEVEVPAGSPLDKILPPSPYDTQPQRQVPAHPPWTRKESERSPDMPLLAPVYGQRPEDRPMSVDGRLFGQFLYYRDNSGESDNEYITSRLGTRLEITNPFNQAGRILFDGEGAYRRSEVFDERVDHEERLRLDRLSYAVGGQDYASYRFEGGRFFSYYLPELGLIDGAEGALQLNGGVRAGGGFGSLGRPFQDRAMGEDFGFHLFVDYEPDSDSDLQAIVAFQKTWHEGAPDRDLLLGRINLKPIESLWLYCSWKVDIYTEGDSIKGSGLDLTELWVQARYTPNRKTGVSASYSHYSWPQLKRDEFENLPEELVRDGRIDRLSLSAWYRLFEQFRVSGRFNIWADQDHDGTGGEVGFNWTKITSENTSLYGSVYYINGSFNDGVGFRVQPRQPIGDAFLFVGYELFRYSTEGLVTGDEDFTRQTLRAGLDWNIGDGYYSLSGDYYFGDEEDAFTIGIYAQYRF